MLDKTLSFNSSRNLKFLSNKFSPIEDETDRSVIGDKKIGTPNSRET